MIFCSAIQFLGWGWFELSQWLPKHNCQLLQPLWHPMAWIQKSLKSIVLLWFVTGQVDKIITTKCNFQGKLWNGWKEWPTKLCMSCWIATILNSDQNTGAPFASTGPILTEIMDIWIQTRGRHQDIEDRNHDTYLPFRSWNAYHDIFYIIGCWSQTK